MQGKASASKGKCNGKYRDLSTRCASVEMTWFGWGEEEEDQDDEEEDGDAEEAAFGADGVAGEQGVAEGVGGEEAALHEAAGVGDAVEEGLGPVPCGVEADGPPERAGAPEREDEDDSGQED